MKPNPNFSDKPKEFWANVKTISEQVGYTLRGKDQIKIPSRIEIINAYRKLGLNYSKIIDNSQSLTEWGKNLIEYFTFRATVLNNFVKPRLMNSEKAKTEYELLRRRLSPRCPIPMNKQKGEKKAPAYLTCIVNMIIQENIGTLPCDYDPRALTTVTQNGFPLRTLSRWIDGAFPSIVNPIAIWEIKEYYYTTTFGSRVADGVYETLLDGMELEELQEHEGINVLHYLIIDAYYTWWDCGRSYLCRIIDMLHMGFVDEVLFGYEVIETLPTIVKEWIEIYEKTL